MEPTDLAERRSLGTMLGDTYSTGKVSSQTTGTTKSDGGNDVRVASALKRRLRLYASRLRKGVMASLQPPYGRGFVGKVCVAISNMYPFLGCGHGIGHVRSC